MSDLKREFDFYVAHQAELVGKYEGQYLVIKDEQVQAAFGDELEAYKWATERFALGSFLLQRCLPGEESYSQTFYSRVAVG